MTSDEAVGPIDIQQLLDLLNASDRSEEPRNDGRTIAQPNELHSGTRFSDAEQLLGATAKETSTEARVPPSETPVSDDTENRFAAHIVHGMSKLKGG